MLNLTESANTTIVSSILLRMKISPIANGIQQGNIIVHRTEFSWSLGTWKRCYSESSESQWSNLYYFYAQKIWKIKSHVYSGIPHLSKEQLFDLVFMNNKPETIKGSQYFYLLIDWQYAYYGATATAFSMNKYALCSFHIYVSRHLKKLFEYT